MKKEILLGIAFAALYAAAKEYGIKSLDDLKAKASPYMKLLELADLMKTHESPAHSNGVAKRKSTTGSKSNHSGNGRSQRVSG